MTRDHHGRHLLANDVTMTSTDNNNNNAMVTSHTWDIADNVFPIIEAHDEFVEYPLGYVKYAYRGDCVEARTHQSGWAARNANNHNQAILKKSCLGVLLCDRQCQTDDGKDIVRVRPSICDKARKKQINKSCPTKGCTGRLRLRPCKGHGGYPVTHFWREVRDLRPGVTTTTIFFQAKGEHDHPPPQRKSVPAPARAKARLKENRKPVTPKVRRRKLRVACSAVKMTSSARYHDVLDKQPPIDGMSLAEPQYSTLNPGHHMTPYNSNCHVTSLTNYSSPYDRLQALGSGFGQRSGSSFTQTFSTNYGVSDVFTNNWNNIATPLNIPRNQLTDAFQPTKCLPTTRQLPVSFDDVISARQRADEYYGDGGVVYPTANHITWSEGPRQLCQYGKNSVSGLSASSFGTCHMTCSSTSPVTIYPPSSPSWLAGHPEPSYKACAEYRMSRHHVVSDITSAECDWIDVCDFDETVWQEKFVTPPGGL